MSLLLLLACTRPGGDDSALQDALPAGVWLKGDLHLHSAWSDDAEDAPMDELVPLAESLGMDWFVLTDHDDHRSGDVASGTWSDPLYASEEMLVFYGVEYSTDRGHVNFFGLEPWDHLALWELRDGEAQPYLDLAHQLGLHASVNHPANKDSWEHSFDLDYDSMEVWQGVQGLPQNETAPQLWDTQLQQRRLTGRGGSDAHHLHNPESEIFQIGNPTTWVYASERSQAAVLEALQEGRVSVSYAAQAERIDLLADADRDGRYDTVCGQVLPADGEPVHLAVDIVGYREGASYEIRVIKDGEDWQTLPAAGPRTEIVDPEGGQRAYYRVVVSGETPLAPADFDFLYMGQVGMTNPIYVGYE